MTRSTSGRLHACKNPCFREDWMMFGMMRLLCRTKGFLSKYECEIGISNAITGIYVLHDNSTINRIEEIVKDDSLINFLFIAGTDNLKLESINLKEYRELLETMRRHNEGKDYEVSDIL